MRKTSRWRWLWLPFAGLGSLYLVQLPFRAAGAPAAFELIAHRGVHQTFHSEGLTNETCTAERIDAPRHAYLENTPCLRCRQPSLPAPT
jgi:glycerophosphoryl diester phosphodiesterase